MVNTAVLPSKDGVSGEVTWH